MKKTIKRIGVLSVSLLALAASVNAQWTENATSVYLTNGAKKVGIGTPAPSYPLDIKQAANCSFRIQSITSGSANLILSRSAAAGNNCLVNYKTGATDLWYTGVVGTNNDFRIRNAAGTDNLFISQANGAFGFNTTAPSARYHMYAPGAHGNYAAAGPLMVGDVNDHFMQVGEDFLQARYIGLGSTHSLYLNPQGGYVEIGLSGGTGISLYNYGSARLATSNANINVDFYDGTIAGQITDGSGWQVNSGVGGNAGTGSSWAMGTTGTNFYIGTQDGTSSGTLQTAIQVTGSRNVLLAPTSGFVGINQTVPSHRLEVRHATGFNVDGFRLINDFAAVNYWDQYVYTGFQQLAFSSNGIERTYINGTTGAVTQASDERLKSNVKPAENMLENLMKLDVKSYTYIKNNPANRSSTGIMAQQLNKYFPEFVYEIDRSKDGGNADGSDNTFSVDYAGLSVVAIKAIQEQQKLIEEKDAKVAELQNQLNDMQQCVASLCDAQTSKVGTSDNNTTQLFQNSPNPFNQTTVIKYALNSENKNGKIIIRDLNGNLVKQINIANTGKGQVTINANELTQGTYTYTLDIAGVSVDTKLMVVTK